MAVMIAGLRDSDASVRVRCCEILGRAGGPEALAELIASQQRDSDIDVRLAATRAMANFRDKQAISAMLVVLEDRDPALQYQAMESLRTMTGRDYGNDVNRWREFVQGGNPAPVPSPSVAHRIRTLFVR